MRTKEIKAMIKEGLFKSGTTLDRRTVEKLTRRARPSAVFNRKTIKMQIASNLKLVEFQHSVNNELHEKGLHLSSRDYYSEFYVVPRAKTGPIVSNYFSKALGASLTGQALQEGRRKTSRKAAGKQITLI
jgi:hypothetical protein